MSDEIQRQALARDIARRLQLASLDEVRVVDRVLLRLEQTRRLRAQQDFSEFQSWLRERERDDSEVDALISVLAARLAQEDRDRAALHEAARDEMLGVEQVVETAWIKPDLPIAGPARFELKRRTPEGRRAYILGLEQDGAITPEMARALLEVPELGGEG